jgi:5-enolpyruvylshikimate-3-phosphate synthase
MLLEVKPLKKISAQIEVPPDKSISHRAVMLSSIADGISTVENFLPQSHHPTQSVHLCLAPTESACGHFR